MEESPKEYLRQLERLNAKIEHKRQEAEMLRTAMQSLSVKMDADRVQTSHGDKMPENVAALIDLEKEIETDTIVLISTRDKIINQIHSLPNCLYIKILYKRYVEYKRLEQIAVELHYSYDRIKHLHGDALQVFGKINKPLV